ncbi:MAG: cation diffusion facilitator family transporter [Planctomycetota bacterium]
MTDEKHSDAGVIKTLIAGIVANMGLGIIKLIAWFFTQSSAMLAEALHSMADSSNQILLAVGLKRSKKVATEKHPFGFDKERYFWSFLVSLLIFLVGGAFAIYEGVHKVSHPTPVTNVKWVYIALGMGLFLEGFALRVAFIEFKHFRANNPGTFFQSLKDTKDPTLPTVLFEDAAALVGLIIALVGITIAYFTGNGIWDGAASILIGVLLVGVSWFLAVESHSLLVGESASRKDQATIREIVDSEPQVNECIELITLQRGPSQILVALTLDFQDDMKTQELETLIARIEDRIREKVYGANHIFIEVGSLRLRGRRA